MHKKILLIAQGALLILATDSFAGCGTSFFDPTKPPKAIFDEDKDRDLPFKLVMVIRKEEEKPYAHFSVKGEVKKVREGDYIEGFKVVTVFEDSVDVQDEKGHVTTVDVHSLEPGSKKP